MTRNSNGNKLYSQNMPQYHTLLPGTKSMVGPPVTSTATTPAS